MRISLKSLLVAAAIAVASGVGMRSAEAQESRVSVPLRTERVASRGPNPTLLRSGAWTLGASYVPALVVAIKSERRGDDYLYYPVAGPWLDLAHRGECSTCRHETLNQALLVADGVFQGIGALQIVGSFLLPERPPMPGAEKAHHAHAKSADNKPSSIKLRVRPIRLSSGYGLQATARF